MAKTQKKKKILTATMSDYPLSKKDNLTRRFSRVARPFAHKQTKYHHHFDRHDGHNRMRASFFFLLLLSLFL